MADSIRLYRMAVQQLVAQALGTRIEQPRLLAAHARTLGQETEIMALPVSVESYSSAQVLDVASSDFGKFYYLPDYDPPDDPNYPVL